MPRGPRTSRKVVNRLSVDDRTADIMAAARALIAERGYENTLLSEIAERAGVVEGTIYRYFESKRELLEKVAAVWFGEQLAEDSQVDSIGGTQNKLRHLAWKNLSIIRREPVLARFMLLELRPDPNYRHTPFFQLNRKFTSDVLRVCQAAIDSGEFLPDVPATTLRDMFYGCMEHRTWAFLRGEGDFSLEEVADSVARVIHRGMAARREEDHDGLRQVLDRVERIALRIEKHVVGEAGSSV